MSANLTPWTSSSEVALDRPDLAPAPAPPQHWGGPAASAEEGGGINIARYVAALKRYKWLMLLVVLIGTGVGALATRFIEPQYEARATLFLAESQTPLGDKGGPISAEPLFASAGWVELLRSFRISDAVVTKLALYLTPAEDANPAAFQGFGVSDALRPGEYALSVDRSGKRWSLATAEGQVVEEGQVGDSVGRAVGFRWRPPASALRAGQSMEFTVVTPREASITLAQSLSAHVPPRTNFLALSLTGPDPQRAAATLNAWTTEFVAVAGEMKRRNLTEFARILDGQLGYAAQQLKSNESALESFRVNTITQPTDRTPIAAGVEATRDPVIGAFFDQKIQYDQLRFDRQQLERALADARRNGAAAGAVLAIPSVATNPAAAGLRGAIEEMYAQEAKLRTAREYYTDEHQAVKELQRSVETLQRQTIPQLAAGLLAQLRDQERALEGRIRSQSQELQRIPSMSIEEERLRREKEIAENLYTTLQRRYEEAKLAEASAVPDVAVLDSAIAPLNPTKNTAPRIILIALAASVGLAVGLALLLDLLDRRFRYPEQVTQELGLDIVGAVPALSRLRAGGTDPDEATQMVEAFRSIRLALRHQFNGSGPVELTVTSPGVGDGKSLVSSNLALSFAEAGYRTLLIDGDIRRGTLHTTFNVPQSPGLLDCLAGEATRAEIVHDTAYDHLSLVPCGARRRRGPELLASAAMNTLLDGLRHDFDAIIVDSAPLGAGIDPYALGTATGSLLLVFRSGETDRKLAQAKLTVVDRLPVRVLGAVLNGIKPEGSYQYYTYIYGYGVPDDEESKRLGSSVGQLAART